MFPTLYTAPLLFDLGRISDWGSVCVDESLTIERYSHVMHLVSNVKSRLRCDCTTIDSLRPLFPSTLSR
nr:chorismate-binding protein [Gloeotrichia echinulata DEX184]